MDIYYIGGSPCSGKSTAAQALSKAFGLYYFKVDDHLDRYMQSGAADGKHCCASIGKMTPEQIWMRAPQEQCHEELAIYHEIIEYILTDLKNMGCCRIITEGAAFLPELIREHGIASNRYISLTPTKVFQVTHYSQRPWVSHVLAGCIDKTKAFDNWMERDALFAKAVQQQCAELGYVSVINDGSRPAEELISQIAKHFDLQ